MAKDEGKKTPALEKGPAATLDIYLGEIKEFDLLDAEKEVDLANRIAQGDPEAREAMIRSNLRLVVSIAKMYANKGLGFLDLIEEGNLGLMRAVEAFDPGKGCRFSTYATYWITQSIRRALDNNTKVVHVPAYIVELIRKIRVIRQELHEKLERDPSVEELAEALDVSPSNVQRAMETHQTLTTPVPIDGENASEDAVPDHRNLDPGQIILERHQLEELKALIERMDKREAMILKYRFGLGGEESLTLREIGDRVGLTRERVRQIEKDALRRLERILDGRG